MPWPYVELMQSDIDYADQFARLQHEFAQRTRLPGSNAAPPNVEYDIRGMRGEYAFYLWLRPCKWVHYVGWPDGKADFEDFINVKERAEHWNHLVIQPRKLNVNHVYAMVFGHLHPVYLMGPWCWGRDIVGHPTSDRGRVGGDAMYIDQTNPIMHHPDELFALVRKQQIERFGAFGIEDARDFPWIDCIGEIRPEAQRVLEDLL